MLAHANILVPHQIGLWHPNVDMLYAWVYKRIIQFELAQVNSFLHDMAHHRPFSGFLLLLTILQGSSTVQNQCWSNCSMDSDCSSPLTCISGQCNDKPLGSNQTHIETNQVVCSDNYCCEVGTNYSLYYCSPALEETNKASMIAITSENYTGLCRIDFKQSEKQVAMSTGWFDNKKSCFRSIRIFGNNTNVTAEVIDVCDSKEGCTQQLQYHPPCENNIISATNSVWKALGVIKKDSDAKKMAITWRFEDTRSPPSRFEDTQSPPPPFGKKNNTRNGNHNSRTRKIIVIIAALFGSMLGFLSILLCVFSAYKWWKKKVQDQRNNRVLLGTREALPRQFEYDELQTATQNFRTTLGSGGFGCVFKGALADGTEIAVKRMEGANEGEKQFIAEVMSVGSIHHVNLVRLRGFCIHIPYYMLVYEFMCNGSLDKWIFMDENKPKLDWQKRFNIAVEVARGLSYLHDGCRERVLHLDLKPQNILLDGDFKPKIADFGLAKLVAKNGSVTATGVRGTIGYMAPEWLQSRITDKTDIYSFGVVLLEIVSGKLPFGTFQSLQLNSDLSVATLGDFVQAKVQNGNLIDAIDTCLLPAADPSFKLDEAERVVRVGMLCIQDEPHQRPSITDALKMLDGSLTIEHKITCST